MVASLWQDEEGHDAADLLIPNADMEESFLSPLADAGRITLPQIDCSVRPASCTLQLSVEDVARLEALVDDGRTRLLDVSHFPVSEEEGAKSVCESISHASGC